MSRDSATVYHKVVADLLIEGVPVGKIIIDVDDSIEIEVHQAGFVQDFKYSLVHERASAVSLSLEK